MSDLSIALAFITPFLGIFDGFYMEEGTVSFTTRQILYTHNKESIYFAWATNNLYLKHAYKHTYIRISVSSILGGSDTSILTPGS